jgi:hypothetical protein
MLHTDWETVARCIFKDNGWLDMDNQAKEDTQILSQVQENSIVDWS